MTFVYPATRVDSSSHPMIHCSSPCHRRRCWSEYPAGRHCTPVPRMKAGIPLEWIETLPAIDNLNLQLYAKYNLLFDKPSWQIFAKPANFLKSPRRKLRNAGVGFFNGQMSMLTPDQQLQESSAKLTNQRVSCAFTSSLFSFHACHILPTSTFRHSYFTYFLYQ